MLIYNRTKKTEGEIKNRSQRDHTYPAVGSKISCRIIIEQKNRGGDKKPIPKGSNIHRIQREKDIRPRRGRTSSISQFEDVASRWDAVSVEIRGWIIIVQKKRGE
jgi:hypothetical protein